MHKASKFIRIRNDQTGYALIWTCVILIVSSLVLIPLLMFMTSGILSSNIREESMQSFYAADAGVEDGIRHVQRGSTLVDPFELNGANVSVSVVEIDSATYKITSTATETDDGKLTTIESYVTLTTLEFAYLVDHAITSLDDISTQSNVTVNGNVRLPPAAELQMGPGSTINGDTTRSDLSDVWPTTEQLSYRYLSRVADLDPFPYEIIDVVDTGTIGPLYRNGSLQIKNGSHGSRMAVLNGTVYVTGDLSVGDTGHEITIDLNGHAFYVEGRILFGGKSTVSGSGAIIAVQDIDFQPNISSSADDFIVVMSTGDRVDFQPGSDFYGCLLSSIKVEVSPGATIHWTGPVEEGQVDFPLGGSGDVDRSAPEIRTYIISS